MPRKINNNTRECPKMNYFLFFFLLNLPSNLFGLRDVYLSDEWAVFVEGLSIIALTALSAVIESYLLYICRKHRILRNSLFVVMVAFHLFLIAAETFLFSEFGLIIGQDVIDILSETNPKESTEFIQTYFSWRLLPIAVFPGFVLFFARFVNRWSNNKYINASIFVLCIYGLILILNGIISYVRFRNGDRLPQMTSITRGGYAFYIMHKQSSQFETIMYACRNCDAKILNNTIPFRRVVVVLGESSSYYHCSLYGYAKPTFPRMSQLQADSSLIAYNDVVTPEDATHGVMKSVFSLDRNAFGSSPLFPALFKKVGYYTQLIDNQYFISHGVNFLTDPNLSDELFDNRNKSSYGYDGSILQDLQFKDSLTLNILHLNGQHYTYQKRYPPEFNIFRMEEYDAEKYSIDQRSTIASYDNAGHYCDYVLGELINKLQFEDAILFFLSDHGEEVFDVQDYMGHGKALSSPNPNYQLKVPFFIWMSDYARELRPELFHLLHNATSVPAITSDFSHIISSVCGIESTSVKKENCFVLPVYDTSKPRIVLHSIDYDLNFAKIK